MGKPSKKDAANAKRRVTRAHNDYIKARNKLVALTEKHEAIFTEVYELIDIVNAKKNRLDAAVRESNIGVGTISVIPVKKVVFDADYLAELFEDNDEVLDELITVKRSVNATRFDSLVREDVLTKKQISRAVLSRGVSYRVSGIPETLNLP